MQIIHDTFHLNNIAHHSRATEIHLYHESHPIYDGVLMTAGARSGQIQCFQVDLAHELFDPIQCTSSFEDVLSVVNLADWERYGNSIYMFPAQSDQSAVFDFDQKHLTLSNPWLVTTGLTAWYGEHLFGSYAYIPSYAENIITQFHIEANGRLKQLKTPQLYLADIYQPTVLLESNIRPNDFYLAQMSGSTIAMLHRSLDGALTDTGKRFPLEDNGTNMLFMEENNGYVYVLSASSNRIYEFHIDPTTGDLVALKPAWIDANGQTPVKILFHGNHAYVIYRLTMSVGVLTVDGNGQLSPVQSVYTESRSFGSIIWNDLLMIGSSTANHIRVLRILPDGKLDTNIKVIYTTVPDPQFLMEIPK